MWVVGRSRNCGTAVSVHVEDEEGTHRLGMAERWWKSIPPEYQDDHVAHELCALWLVDGDRTVGLTSDRWPLCSLSIAENCAYEFLAAAYQRDRIIRFRMNAVVRFCW